MSVSSIGNLFSLFTPSKPPPPKSPSFRSSRPYNRLAVVSSCSDSDVRSVVWPSVAYANTLYFRSAYNVQVIVDDNEPEEKLLGCFRREVMRAGVIQECKHRRFFENKQDKDKRKSREAARRNRRRLWLIFNPGEAFYPCNIRVRLINCLAVYLKRHHITYSCVRMFLWKRQQVLLMKEVLRCSLQSACYLGFCSPIKGEPF